MKVLNWTPAKWDDNGETYTRQITVKVPRGATIQDLREWARDNFYTYCQHSYDCCGGMYGGPGNYRHAKRREWVFTYCASRNI
jgi:hypothetical protein